MESGDNALVLMYHRIAAVASDPFSLCVTPEHFSEHLQVLRRRCRLLPFGEIVEGIHSGTIAPGSVALTFDDGYADNLYAAKPRLERYDAPAACFIATAPVERRQPFWWDELERLFLQPGKLPARLTLQAAGSSRTWDLGSACLYTDAELLQHREWRSGSGFPTFRHSLFDSLWRLLRPLPDIEQWELLDQLRTWAGSRAMEPANAPPLSNSELLELARGGLIEIGAHTMTHPALPELTPAQQRLEIQGCRSRLEDMGFRANSFAYPYGAHADVTATLVAEEGFRCACTTSAAPVASGADLFRLPRIHVRDWNGEEFTRRLEQWLRTPADSLAWSESQSTGSPDRAPWLRVAGGSIAWLDIVPEGGGMRIAIDKAAARTPFDIQLNYPAPPIRDGRCYTISFRARADRPRGVCLGFSQARDPWAGLGLYKTIRLTPEWQSVREEFVATASEDVTRIHLDLGDEEISVELSPLEVSETPNSIP